MLGNDPRPHYAHQSNLAEDRILYPVLDGVIDRFKATYAANSPLLHPTMKESATLLQQARHLEDAAERGHRLRRR